MKDILDELLEIIWGSKPKKKKTKKSRRKKNNWPFKEAKRSKK